MIGYILKKKVTIFGSGKQVRDLLFVDDLVELYFKLFKNIKRVSGKAFNVGGGIFNTLSLLELDMLLKDKFNLKNNVKFEKARAGDQKIFISDNAKLKKTLNWKPKTKLKEGLVLLFNWLSHNKIIVKNTLEK
jgi:CDP-paratose 2-epimerase